MRSIIRSTSELAEMRSSLRRHLSHPDDDPTTFDDFVAAVNEVVAAAVTPGDDHHDDVAGVEVRGLRRTHPKAELYAEVRSTVGTPGSLTGEGIPARLLQRFAERVDFDERIGGSVITVRCRV